MGLEHGMVEYDGGVAIEAGDTHDGVDECVYEVEEEACDNGLRMDIDNLLMGCSREERENV